MELIVKNPEQIKQLATDVVRMANAEHPMLEETYGKLVDAGINTPSYTQMTLKKAEYDSYIKAAQDLGNLEINSDEYLNKIKRTRNSLSKLERSPKGNSLFGSLKTTYPKTVLKRVAILGGLSEGHKELKPCSANKFIKKFTLRFLKFVNR